MSRSSNDCPKLEVLRGLLEGDDAPQTDAKLAAHIDQCASCRHILDRLMAHDPDVALLRERVAGIAGTAETEAAAGTSGAFPSPDVPLEIPGFRVLSEIGRGGMGRVYEAIQIRAGRKVALKMTKAGVDADLGQLRRFRAEAETAAQLQHPNIVQIFEVGDFQGQPFFAMEFCAGGTLANQLRGTPVSATQAAQWCRTLAIAVEAAHERRILHRDLKPANVLLTQDGTLKIADFGLAARLDQPLHQTMTGVPLGTPSYMAPEQAKGKTSAIGPATDVYALGAILYELLTGRPPFQGDNTTETIRQVNEDDPVSPKTLQPKTPRDLETICLKCLQKEAGKRYVSARELAEDLQRFLDGNSIMARRVGSVERLGKWARRHPAATAAGLFFVLSVGLLTWALLNENLRSRERARHDFEKLTLALAEAAAAHNVGNWSNVLLAFDQATALGHDLTPLERLRRANAHANLFQHANAQAELDLLTVQTDGQINAQKNYLQANLLWEYDAARARVLMQGAISHLENSADRAHAQGMIAENTPGAIAFFSEALKANRFHAEARRSLGLCQLCLDDLPIARATFDQGNLLTPDDPSWALGLSLVDQLEQKNAPLERPGREAPLERFKMLGKELDPSMMAILNEGLPLRPALLQLLMANSGQLTLDVDEQVRINLKLHGLKGKFSPAGQNAEGAGQARFFPMKRPPSVKNYLEFWRDEVPRLAAPDMPDQPMRRKVAEIDKLHPDGFLRMFLAHNEMNQLNFSHIVKIPAEDLMRVSALYQRAHESSGGSEIRRAALDGWILMESIRGQPWHMQSDAKARSHAAELVDEYVQRFRVVPAARWELYVKASINGGNYDVARLVVKQWLAVAPDDSTALLLRARLEHRAGITSEALEWARKALGKQQTEPARKELQQILQLSLQKLRALLADLPADASGRQLFD